MGSPMSVDPQFRRVGQVVSQTDTTITYTIDPDPASDSSAVEPDDEDDGPP